MNTLGEILINRSNNINNIILRQGILELCQKTFINFPGNSAKDKANCDQLVQILLSIRDLELNLFKKYKNDQKMFQQLEAEFNKPDSALAKLLDELSETISNHTIITSEFTPEEIIDWLQIFALNLAEYSILLPNANKNYFQKEVICDFKSNFC